MTVRAAIYQPQYFPRLHYINRVLDADVFVVLASAQYTKSLTHRLPDGGRERRKSYQSHAPIRNHDGEHLLTVPVTSDSKHAPIDEVRPDDRHDWRRPHLKTLQAAYGRAACFDVRFPEVDAVLQRSRGTLADLDTLSLLWALDVVLGLEIGIDDLDLDTVNDRLAIRSPARLRRIVRDADTGVERPEGRQMGGVWTAALCEAVGADEYLYGGTAGAGYMDPADYTERGIALVEQDWHARPYPQQFGDRGGFVPNLSVLDLLFNVEPAEAFDILFPAVAGTSEGALPVGARQSR